MGRPCPSHTVSSTSLLVYYLLFSPPLRTHCRPTPACFLALLAATLVHRLFAFGRRPDGEGSAPHHQQIQFSVSYCLSLSHSHERPSSSSCHPLIDEPLPSSPLPSLRPSAFLLWRTFTRFPPGAARELMDNHTSHRRLRRTGGSGSPVGREPRPSTGANSVSAASTSTLTATSTVSSEHPRIFSTDSERPRTPPSTRPSLSIQTKDTGSVRFSPCHLPLSAGQFALFSCCLLVHCFVFFQYSFHSLLFGSSVFWNCVT